MASWSGIIGAGASLSTGQYSDSGRPQGGTAGYQPGVVAGRDYDILAGAVVAYAEADLGIVRPFVGWSLATADGDPTDRQLHGFDHAAGAGNYADHGNAVLLPLGHEQWVCGAGLLLSSAGAGLTNAVPGHAPATALPPRWGQTVLAGARPSPGYPAVSDCAHTTGNPFNDASAARLTWGSARPTPTRGRIVIPAGCASSR